jgi:hypothetical protein
MEGCSHLGHVVVTRLPDPIEGCRDCLAAGTRWVHLRMCAECGRIGCCDSSPMRHASSHARESGHPVVCSAEPGESWFWCYVDEVGFELGGGAE